MRPITKIASFSIITLTLAACATARPPIREMRITSLAHELHEATSRTHDSARSERRRDRHENHAVRALAELEGRARHFHRQVERDRGGPGHLRADFQKLLGSYRAAARWVPELDRRESKREFRRAGRLLNELSEMLGLRPQRDDHDDDHHHGDHGDRGDRDELRRYEWYRYQR